MICGLLGLSNNEIFEDVEGHFVCFKSF